MIPVSNFPGFSRAAPPVMQRAGEASTDQARQIASQLNCLGNTALQPVSCQPRDDVPPVCGTNLSSAIAPAFGDRWSQFSPKQQQELDDLVSWMICAKKIWPAALKKSSAVQWSLESPLSVVLDSDAVADVLKSLELDLIWSDRRDLSKALMKIADEDGLAGLQNHPAVSIDPPPSFEKLPPTVQSWLLRTVEFNDINLENFDLSNRDLRGINVRAGAFDNVNFCKSRLDYCLFEKTSSQNANFNEATLRGASLSSMKLNGGQLHKADLSDAYLAGIILTKADLREAKLCRADLSSADLSGADLCGADLSDIECDRANFSGAKLEKTTKCSLSKLLLDRLSDNVDYFINHLNNENRGLLVTINGIDARYADLRNPLMASVLARLEQLPERDLAHSWASLADVLLKEPSYSKDESIKTFIQNRLLPKRMASWNLEQILQDEVGLSLVLEHLNATFAKQRWHLPKYQGAVNQLLHMASDTDNQYVQLQAAALRRAFLDSVPIRDAVPALELIEQGLAKSAYVFGTADGTQTLACEPELFNAFAEASDNAVPWASVYWLRRDSASGAFQNQPISDEAQVFGAHPFLNRRYLGYTHRLLPQAMVEAGLASGPLKARLVEALQCRSLGEDKKLLSIAHQNMLHDHFAPLWQVDDGDSEDPQNVSRHLQPKHQETLWQNFAAHGVLEDIAPNRAKLMLCLSAMFTRYSSSALFGKEMDSPTALRMHALALLNEAQRLDPSLVIASSLRDWQIKLVGLEGTSDTCTAILSDSMTCYISDKAESDPALKSLFLSLYPGGWR